jgi:hypothetical protein
MACAHIFNWINQNTDTQQFAAQHYPVSFDLAQNAKGLADWSALIDDLTDEERAQLLAEERSWRVDYGNDWEQAGCTPYSHGYTLLSKDGTVLARGPLPKAEDPYAKDIVLVQSALAARGYDVGDQGVWGERLCASVYQFKREKMHDFSSQLDAGFFSVLGFDKETSYKYEEMFKNACVGWYTAQIAPMVDDVRGIQEALYAKGYNPGSTNGVMDGKTTTALRAFQHAETGSSSNVISADTFYALGYTADFAKVLADRYGSMGVEGFRVGSPRTVRPHPVRVSTAQVKSMLATEQRVAAAQVASLTTATPETKSKLPEVLIGAGLLLGATAVAVFLGKRGSR